MIKINDIFYEIDLLTILEELKLQLADKGLFKFMKDTQDDIMVTCPFHKGGQERRASCGIRKSDGWVHCFTCGESCSLVQMISRCFGYDDLGQYGFNWLRNNFLGELPNKRDFNFSYDRKVFEQSKQEFVPEWELEKYRFWHPYMQERKIEVWVAELFDVGWDKETNCLTFPIRDLFGRTLFVARRSTVTKYFNYPSGAEKPVYGVYELYKQKEFPKEVYICESMIDALTLWGVGKYAVALNGLGTEKQFEELNKLPCRKYILATDNDNAGQKARMVLKQKIKNKLVTEVVLPENRKDINECDREELLKLQEVF